jgi:hypothetical protein
MDMSQTEWKRTGEKYSQLNADAGFYMIRNGAAKTLSVQSQALVARTIPLFSNFLFTNLFPIKFLYFFIISWGWYVRATSALVNKCGDLIRFIRVTKVFIIKTK